MRDRPKIIFLNRFFYPDHSATSQLLTEVATALVARGVRVEVITSRLRYDDPGVRLAPSETVRGVEVVRIRTSGFGRTRMLGRAVDYLTFYMSAAYRLFRSAGRGDVVVAKTDPPMLSIIVAPIARMRGVKYVNWLQDLFPEVAEASQIGNGRLGRMSFPTLKRLRDASLRGAHLNVVLGERMAERVALLGVAPGRVRVIPNWADGGLISAVDPLGNRLRREWGLADAFVVGYSGNLGRAHEIETLLAAIGHLEREGAAKSPNARSPNGSARPEIRWLFVGGGALSQQLRAEVERRGLTTVQFRPYQPRERLAESLSAADVHLISLRPELEGLIVPSKYYGIAAAGRPAIFIGDHRGEIAGILQRSGTGMVVAEGDGAGLAEAVRAYADDPELRNLQGVRARQLFEARFDIGHAVGAWEQAIQEAMA